MQPMHMVGHGECQVPDKLREPWGLAPATDWFATRRFGTTVDSVVGHGPAPTELMPDQAEQMAAGGTETLRVPAFWDSDMGSSFIGER